MNIQKQYTILILLHDITASEDITHQAILYWTDCALNTNLWENRRQCLTTNAVNFQKQYTIMILLHSITASEDITRQASTCYWTVYVKHTKLLSKQMSLSYYRYYKLSENLYNTDFITWHFCFPGHHMPDKGQSSKVLPISWPFVLQVHALSRMIGQLRRK